MSSTGAQLNREMQLKLMRSYRLLRRVRPGALGAFLLKVTAPDERRRILTTSAGLRIYADPCTHLGGSLVGDGAFESETEATFRKYIRTGDAFLDIGSNEGYFSALVSTIVGSTGMVISVEPQTRLCDLIEINLHLNAARAFRIYNNAVGGEEGETGTINLWPSFNTGASSILSRYRFSRTTQAFTYVSPERLLRESNRSRFDFVKIDVEGYEAQVVKQLLPQLTSGRIRWLFVDYHAPMLKAHGVDARTIHGSIVATGARLVEGDPENLRSYLLYEGRAA